MSVCSDLCSQLPEILVAMLALAWTAYQELRYHKDKKPPEASATVTAPVQAS
jgi:hypothetical protein